MKREIFLKLQAEKLRNELLNLEIELQELRLLDDKKEISTSDLERNKVIGFKDVKKASIYSTQEKINLIKKSLQKFENGKYGYCESCDQEISEEDLLMDLTSFNCERCLS